jgi:N-acetyltransferase
MTALNLSPSLTGEKAMIRPLQLADWDALFAIAQDKDIWAMHPMHDRWQEPVFRKFFDDAMANNGPMGGSFVIMDRATGDIIGSTRYSGMIAPIAAWKSAGHSMRAAIGARGIMPR